MMFVRENFAFPSSAMLQRGPAQHAPQERQWTLFHWAVALACGSFFGVTNFIQTAAITGGFGGPIRLISYLVAFLAVYNLVAISLRLAWRLPVVFGSSAQPNLPGVGGHLGVLIIAGATQLYAISLLTAFARAPGDWRVATDTYFVEIAITCTPIWVFVYVIFSAILRLVPQTIAEPTNTPALRLEYREAGASRYVPVDAIQLIEAQGNYAQIVSTSGTVMVRKSIAALEATLPSSVFLRTHRGVIVRKALVIEIQRTASGAYRAVLIDGKTVPVSRRRLHFTREALITGADNA